MSRPGIASANLHQDMVDYIDRLVKGDLSESGAAPVALGAPSRDAFVRLCVGIVLMAMQRPGEGLPPLKVVQEIVERLERYDDA